MAATVAYVLKMYPRFSETFILSELLELERQGVTVRVFSLREPDDAIFHADVRRVRARVTYVPPASLRAVRPLVRAHAQAFRHARRPYLRALAHVLAARRVSSLKHFVQAGYIAPALAREGITHVHAHFASSATSVALHLRRLTGVSYSFTAHAKDIYANGVKAADLARKLRAARFAVTVSDYNRRHLRGVESAGRLVRIYNGVDLDEFMRNGSVADVPPLVLAVGRLVEKKGFDDLIRASALLAREGRDFRCRIVGKGPLEKELRSLVRSLGLGDRVELTGPLPRESLRRLYPRASVFVAPCVVGRDGNRDGLPTVLVEAMALGVPVVATRVTGIPELVDDGRTGVVVPERDPEALAAAVRRLLVDRGTARALASAGRTRVERDFDLRANVARLRGLFEEATAA